jgi:hypothetical protein
MKSVARKLAEVMAEVGYVQKDGTNSFHKYSYATAEAVLKKANQALASRGVAVSSSVELLHYEPGHAVSRMSLTFVDSESGESITAQGIGEGSDKGDKSTMKAGTAALKYCLASAFLISWGEDPERDTSTDKRADTVAELVSQIAAANDTDLPAIRETIRKMDDKRELSKADIKKLREAFATRNAA